MKTSTAKEYGRTELAQQYSPSLTPDAAWRRLKRWIALNQDLTRELHQLGYRANHRSFTPRMVSRIFYYLGEP